MTSWAIVREARRRAGLTQRELAARAGTSQSAIARIERGRQIPSVETLQRILRACDLEMRFQIVTHVRHAGDLIYATLELPPEARLRVAEDVACPLYYRSLASAETLTMTTRAGWLDLCTRPAGGQSYDTLAPNAHTYELFGFRARVASLDDVIRSKEAASRDKDLRSLATLRDLQKRLGS